MINFIVVDLEATTRRYKGDKIFLTEIGAVKVDYRGMIRSKFHSYIKPSNPKYVRDIKINGKITTEKINLEKSDNIHVVFSRFKKWIGTTEHVLVFWSDSDLYLIINQYMHEKFDLSWLVNYCDLQEVFCSHIKDRNQYSVHRAIKYLNLTSIGKAHNANMDSYNTAQILISLFNQSTKITFRQNPFESVSCSLNKRCMKCDKIDYYLNFKFHKGKYTNTCRQCHSERKELKYKIAEIINSKYEQKKDHSHY